MVIGYLNLNIFHRNCEEPNQYKNKNGTASLGIVPFPTSYIKDEFGLFGVDFQTNYLNRKCLCANDNN